MTDQTHQINKPVVPSPEAVTPEADPRKKITLVLPAMTDEEFQAAQNALAPLEVMHQKARSEMQECNQQLVALRKKHDLLFAAYQSSKIARQPLATRVQEERHRRKVHATQTSKPTIHAPSADAKAPDAKAPDVNPS